MTTATITLPPVTPAFRDAVRELAYQVGWRNAAKAIAYGPVLAETVAASTCIGSNGNGHKRNGSRKDVTLAFYDTDGLHFATYWRQKLQGEWRSAWELACERAHELERTRFERPIPYPFTPARRTEDRVLDQTNERLALYPKKECCGSPMGIMECWDTKADESVRATYQCAVDAAHREEAYAMSGAIPKSKQFTRKLAEKQTRR